MSQGGGSFNVRRAERFELVVPVRLGVAPPHTQLVRVSAGSGARDGRIDANLVDFSAGGFGIISPIFFPRRCLLSVELLEWGADTRSAEPFARCTARVMRVQMTDRRPAYLIGTQFEVQGPAEQNALHALLETLEGSAVDELRAGGRDA